MALPVHTLLSVCLVFFLADLFEHEWILEIQSDCSWRLERLLFSFNVAAAGQFNSTVAAYFLITVEESPGTGLHLTSYNSSKELLHS